MNRQIHAFILRALIAAEGEPMVDATLKAAIREAFRHVAFTEFDLTTRVQHCESQGWIAGTSTDLSGTVWAITDKGKLALAGAAK